MHHGQRGGNKIGVLDLAFKVSGSDLPGTSGAQKRRPAGRESQEKEEEELPKESYFQKEQIASPNSSSDGEDNTMIMDVLDTMLAETSPIFDLPTTVSSKLMTTVTAEVELKKSKTKQPDDSLKSKKTPAPLAPVVEDKEDQRSNISTPSPIEETTLQTPTTSSGSSGNEFKFFGPQSKDGGKFHKLYL